MVLPWLGNKERMKINNDISQEEHEIGNQEPDCRKKNK